jgi:hypothetical protein
MVSGCRGAITCRSHRGPSLPAVGLLPLLPAGIVSLSVRRQRQSAASQPSVGRRVSLAQGRSSRRLRWAGRRVWLAQDRSSRLAGAGPVVASGWRRAGRRVWLALGRASRLAGARPVVASGWRWAGRRVWLALGRSSRLAGAGPVVASGWRWAGRRVWLALGRSSRLAGAGPVVASGWRWAGRRVSLAALDPPPSASPRPTPQAKANERRSCRFCLATSWSSPPR